MWLGGILMSTIATSGVGEPDGAQQLEPVRRLPDHVEAGVGEQPREPLAQQHLVVGDDDAHGTSARIVVCPAAARSTASSPSSAPMRSSRSTRSSSSVPALSISTTSRPSDTPARTAIRALAPRLTTSATRKYAAASTAGTRRSPGSESIAIGTGPASASASSAVASPSSTSTAG